MVRPDWLWGSLILVCFMTPAAGFAESRKVVAIIVSGIAKSDINPDGISFAHSRKETQEAEGVLAECIERAIAARHSHLRVIMPRDFYHLAFPMLTPEEAPRSLDSQAR